ncbi:hypothetical protein LCGC14_0336490 [marine sediment metagenome]|uniref:Uncharacterized protein n=1 Tax=marine sediment metagenome TaxID=412755 RepID=A0A0F9TKM4_9ZZZZ
MTPAKRRVLSITAVATIFGVAVAIFAAAMHAGRGMGQVQGNTTRIEIHEKKIDDIETIVVKTHTIVIRIDERMNREHP